MAPLTLTVLLLAVQTSAIIVSIRRGIWRATPAWVLYLAIVTVHLVMGILMDVRQSYPISLLYLEPLIIVGQIAFTFESTISYLGKNTRAGSPESKLILWMIPLVPAAIVLPIEIGFIRDALAGWNRDEAGSLWLVYGVRMFLSITLLVILAIVPLAVRLGRRPPRPAVIFHHRLLTFYLACSAVGYVCKSYINAPGDLLITIVFFIVGPLICFLIWSRRMWNASPIDFEPDVDSDAVTDDEGRSFERHMGTILNS